MKSPSQSRFFNLRVFNWFSCVLLIVFCSCYSLNANPLSGSGTLNNPSGPLAAQEGWALGPDTGVFTGSWSPPAASPWVGIFDGTGPQPLAANSGVTHLDFTGITFPTGLLPDGTYFRFSDVDHGSGHSEILQFQAYDVGGSLILTPWLDDKVLSDNIVGANQMPTYSFINGVYTIDGLTVAGNPAIFFTLTNFVPIAKLVITKSDISYGFSLAAPVPEPSSLALVIGALLCAGAAAGRARTRKA
jgi:hypothetical protein